MLTEVYPKLFTDCHAKCGAQIAYKTTKIVYCPTCRKETIRRNSRAAMEKVRRAKGIEPVKGLPFNCSVCGCAYIRNMVRSHRCPKCQAEAALEVSRASAAARNKSEAGRAYARAWSTAKRASSPAWSISARMRTLMHKALGEKKAGNSWKKLVDYSIEELMAHLERQFLPGMTWANRGTWHIDHIIPRSSFQYESADDPEFKSAWALSNLRPIWALDNIRKNATRTHLI